MPAAIPPCLSADALRPVDNPEAAGPGDDDDDDDAGIGGGGSGGNIDPDDDEGVGDDDDDDDDEEPLQCMASGAGSDVSLHRTKSWYSRPLRRPASFDGCPPHAAPDPGNRIIGF